jgi:hypothetical protein
MTQDEFEIEALGLDPDDLAIIAEAENDAEKVVTKSPPKPYQLGYISVFCIIVDKMIGEKAVQDLKSLNQAGNNASACIGTGIFDTGSTIMYGTRSVGVTLIFWVLGGIAALAGTLCFIE